MDAQLWSLKKLERMQVGFTFQTLYILFTDFFFFFKQFAICYLCLLKSLPLVLYT